MIKREVIKKLMEKFDGFQKEAKSMIGDVSSIIKKLEKTLEIDSKSFHEGIPYVDLGLPSGTMWAECNIGSKVINDSGDYIRLEMWRHRDSIAKCSCGGFWGIPWTLDYEELINYCTWEWITQNGVKGYKVTGPNGNSIFLPAGGFLRQFSDKIDSWNTEGCYWLCCGNSRHQFRFCDKKHFIELSDGHKTMLACNIRPVFRQWVM